MKTVELKLEFVTPTFLGGAAQQPEVRTASIRGATRYWLRAALGGVVGDKRLDLLQRVESDVFGRTDRGSTVAVRVREVRVSSGSLPLLPHKSGRNASLAPAIKSGTCHLVLALRPGSKAAFLELAAWSALLWITLGGIGRRSRRGAGSMRIEDVTRLPETASEALKSTMQSVVQTSANGAELAARIGLLTDAATKAMLTHAGDVEPAFSNGPATFSVLHPARTRIAVWTPDNTDLSDSATVLRPLMHGMSNQKAALGEATFQDAFGGIRRRRASPLLCSAHRLSDEWALVMTHFKTKILPEKSGRPDKVDAFLDQLDNAVHAYPRSVAGGGHE